MPTAPQQPRQFFDVTAPPTHHTDVSRETQVRLDAFCDLLLKWNQRINLISSADEPHVRQRHVADSLALVKLIPPDISHAIDIGTGGGFPGLILAISTGLHFHLVESDQRKCAFLREAARLTATTVTLHACRIEEAKVPAAPLITARALAPLPRLLTWAVPHLAKHGICVFPKGRSANKELTAAQVNWNFTTERFASPIDPTSTTLRLSEISRVGQ